MKVLDRKLLRELMQMKTQVVAIALVIASGVATFVMSLSTLESLERTQTDYYAEYRFAHVFGHLKRAPDSLVGRIARIPGVAAVQTRVVVDVTLDVEGLAEPAVGRLISIPPQSRLNLNKAHLRAGRYVESDGQGEVLASETFVDAHGLNVGDRIVAIINGHKRPLEIVGVALSPEYIYSVQPGQLIPDDKRFSPFWMRRTELEAAFDMHSAFNDVCVTLMHDASEADVIAKVDRVLDRYGGLGAYGRKDQLSHSFIEGELDELRGMSLIPPTIFLSVAAFLLNVVLGRMISTQREQIAVLKAFGYTGFDVGLHYFKLALIVALSGVCLGTVAGVWLGNDLTRVYSRFFHFPAFAFHVREDAVLWALLIGTTAAIAGASTAVWRAVMLPPAQAMQPEPPTTHRPTVVERAGLQRLFSHTSRIVLRNIERHPAKSFLSTVGIALGVAVLIMGSFVKDAAEYMMDFEFHHTRRYDIGLTFVEPVSEDAMYEIGHMPGVIDCEPMRVVPTRLRFGHRTRRVGVVGLEAGARLYRVLDEDANAVPLPTEGVMLSEKLAELLSIETGQMLTVEVLEGQRRVREVRVAGLVKGYVGTAAYMDLTSLNRLTYEGPSISGAVMMVDPERVRDLYTLLKNTPKVASVEVKKASLANFRRILTENLLRMRAFNVLFASIIAFGVVYNSARIWLSEQRRDLASLRVLGFTRGEVSVILLGQLATLVLAAIPLGLGMGYGFAALVTVALDTETHRIPLIIEGPTYGFAIVVILAASLISGLVVRNKLDRLDLVASLKAKE